MALLDMENLGGSQSLNHSKVVSPIGQVMWIQPKQIMYCQKVRCNTLCLFTVHHSIVFYVTQQNVAYNFYLPYHYSAHKSTL